MRTWVHEAILVARGIDGHHILEAEVPLQVWLYERRHEAPAGPVDVDPHAEALCMQEGSEVRASSNEAPLCRSTRILSAGLCILGWSAVLTV